MVDLGLEDDQGRLEGIVGGKADLETEDAAREGRLRGAEDHRLPGKEIGIGCGACCTICGWIRLELCIFALKTS